LFTLHSIPILTVIYVDLLFGPLPTLQLFISFTVLIGDSSAFHSNSIRRFNDTISISCSVIWCLIHLHCSEFLLQFHISELHHSLPLFIFWRPFCYSTGVTPTLPFVYHSLRKIPTYHLPAFPDLTTLRAYDRTTALPVPDYISVHRRCCLFCSSRYICSFHGCSIYIDTFILILFHSPTIVHLPFLHSPPVPVFYISI